MNAAAAALVVLNGRQAFDPRASLFAHNEPGFWYDPSDLSSMFQDSAGTTPVTAVEQAVGLILDKIRGLVLGPELVTNGDFSSGTGWTVGAGWAITGGVAEATSASSNLLQTNVAPSPQGKTYRVQLTIVTRSAGSIVPQISGAVATLSAPGTYVFYLTPTGTDATLYIPASGFTGTIDNVSVRQIFGNHAIQPTSASRPTLRARYNLGTYSEDLTNAAWQKLASGTGVVPVVTNNYATAPDGTNTATRVQFDLGATPATAVSRLFQNNNDGRTALRTRRIWLKTTDGTTKTIYMAGPNTANTLQTVTGSWQQFVVPDTVAASAAYAQHQFGLDGSQSTSTSADILVWHPELVYSTDAYLPYQRIAAATDYDTVGFPPYLAFDGSDDSLYTGGNVDFSATDKMTVWAGVTKLSDAAAGAVVELSAGSGAGNPGSFGLFAPQTNAAANYSWRSAGSAAITAVAGNTFASPITNVLTGVADIGGDICSLRADGVVAASDTGDQGTGNFGSYPVFIGRRNNNAVVFIGRIYSLIGRGAATSAALIQQAERWVAGKQGRTL